MPNILKEKKDRSLYYSWILRFLNEHHQLMPDDELPTTSRISYLCNTNNLQVACRLYELITTGCVEAIMFENGPTRYRITDKGRKLLEKLDSLDSLLHLEMLGFVRKKR